MLDALVGSVIMVIATTSLFAAVEVIEKSFADAGRQPLSQRESRLLERVGRADARDQLQFWRDSLQYLPREVLLPRSE